MGQPAGIAAETPALATIAADGAPAEVELDPQLKLNKEALLKGSTIAATVLLFDDDPKPRVVLLDALKQTENSAARMAVCNALIQARASQKTVKNEEDFIGPLVSVFESTIDDEARLAAEAVLIFSYEKIGLLLEEIAADASKPVRTRVNAIRALKLRLNTGATIKLIRLVDSKDGQVAAEAESALRSLGITVGDTPETREQAIAKIRNEGQEAFLRTQLTRQETQMRQMREKVDAWRKRYLSSLGKLYDAVTDEAARGKFLTEHLAGPEPEVKLWALDKVRQWRLSSGTSALPAEQGPVLMNLISDADRDVRLRTADLLALMQGLNSAPRLLAQLKIEQDVQVKTKLLDALGAVLPNSPTKISPEMKDIRKETLVWAATFLREGTAEQEKTGAQVTRKLLERDESDPQELDSYLRLLGGRYGQHKNDADGALRGELLSAMAGLCAPNSACKAKATELFGPLFKVALQDAANFVRESAVDGLANIDKAIALEMLRNDFVNDPSPTLRKKLIAIADEVGGRADLNWLSEKIGSNSESNPVWQAMLKIFKGADAPVVDEWMNKLTSQNSKIKLTNEQQIDFLEIAKTRAGNVNKPIIREKLAELYYTTNHFEQAADYLSMVYDAAQTAEGKKEILPKLLESCLKGSRVERAAELVGNCLAEKDLDPNSTVIALMDRYLVEPPAGADPNVVLKALDEVKAPGRTKWRQWLENWKKSLGTAKDKEADKPKIPGA
ncbi:MAG: hypothetical protein ABIF19_16770 [Planctomycetota bacterium]